VGHASGIETTILPADGSNVELLYDKIARRIMPFLVLLFVVAWLDRINIGFARLQMVEDLGFSDAAFGFGAGIFYLGYLLFEIPSNLMLERIGARKTFARITILWGLTSMMTLLVKTAGWFYFLRFLLGAFEAGLLPGAVLYLTYWFPTRRRARMTGLFLAAIPIAGVLGTPLSGLIMESMGGRLGLANWQWVFLLEGIPSVVLGFTAFAILADKPSQASWLTEAERREVLADLEADNREVGPRQHGLMRVLANPLVWLITLIQFCLTSGIPTVAIWSPTIIQELGVTDEATIGLLLAVPNIIAVICLIVVSRHSDRTLERRYHSALPCLVCAVGLASIGLFANYPPLAFAALVLATLGPVTAGASFWQFPSMLLAGTAAAGGIALINSIGSFSGFVAPFAIGWFRDRTGTTSAGLYVVAGLELIAGVLILVYMPKRRPRLSPISVERHEGAHVKSR
jgi:D-galactonate transporter